MIQPWLVLVESNTTPSGPAFARTARRLGLRPVLLSTDPSRYPWAERESVETRTVDTGDPGTVEAACAELDRRRPVVGATSSSDRFAAAAALVSRRRGLPGPSPEAVRACGDKRRQRELLGRSGLPQPRWIAARSPAEAGRAATCLGFPVVLKPARGTGSSGVRCCASLAEVVDHAARLLATLEVVLVEELVGGPEVSVETFGGEVVGITAKHLGRPPHFVERGHDLPAPLSADAASAAGDVTLRALRTLGLGWGPAHTELRLGGAGPKLIEVNPRLAGGNLPRLIELVTGIDLVGATVAASCGRASGGTAPVAPGAPDRPRSRVAAASIRFLIPERTGRLVRLEGLEASASVPGVVEVAVTVAPGDHLELNGSFGDRAGHVVAVGASLAEAASAVERGLGALRLVVSRADSPSPTLAVAGRG